MAEPGYKGWAALGEMIAGGDRGRQRDTYDKALLNAYRADDAMQQARRARSLALIDADRLAARQGITPDALGELGYSAAAAPVLGDILRSNSTVNLGNLGEFQRPGYDQAAAVAREAILGDAPDVPAYNRANAFMEGKPYDPVVQQGGTMRPLGVALGDPEFVAVPTPEAGARMAALGERTDAAVARDMARAGVYDAQAAVGGFNPNTGRRAGKITNEAEQQAKIDWIMAEGTRLAKDRGEAWAEAWMNEQLAKAGMLVTPARGPQFQNVEGSSSTVPASLGEPAAPDMLAQARDAIARGADPEKVRARLRDLGHADLAGQL